MTILVTSELSFSVYINLLQCVVEEIRELCLIAVVLQFMHCITGWTR